MRRQGLIKLMRNLAQLMQPRPRNRREIVVLVVQFITDPNVSLWSRVKRDGDAKKTVTADWTKEELEVEEKEGKKE